MKSVLIATGLAFGLVGLAHAQTAEQAVSTSGTPSAVFTKIVGAASSLCAAAATRGEVINQTQCVDSLVANAVAEADRPTLTAYALEARPSLARVRLQLAAKETTRLVNIQLAGGQ